MPPNTLYILKIIDGKIPYSYPARCPICIPRGRCGSHKTFKNYRILCNHLKRHYMEFSQEFIEQLKIKLKECAN